MAFVNEQYGDSYSLGNTEPVTSTPQKPRIDPELLIWKKTLASLDSLKYKKFKDDRYWETYERALRVKLRAQGLDDVLDPKFNPGIDKERREIFRLKNKFVFSVLDDSVDTDMGKTIVRKYTEKMDGQKALEELTEYYKKSAQADLWSNNILNYLVTAKFNRSWKGSAQQFILHWTNQLRILDTMQPSTSQVPAELRLTLLQNAVGDVPELSSVQHYAQFDTAKGGSSITYDKYLPLLITAAVNYDKQHSNAKRQAADLRKTLVHDFQYEDGIPDEYYDAHDDERLLDMNSDIDTPPDAYFAINMAARSSEPSQYDVNAAVSG
jgi:hypothetical protein